MCATAKGHQSAEPRVVSEYHGLATYLRHALPALTTRWPAGARNPPATTITNSRHYYTSIYVHVVRPVLSLLIIVLMI